MYTINNNKLCVNVNKKKKIRKCVTPKATKRNGVMRATTRFSVLVLSPRTVEVSEIRLALVETRLAVVVC